MSNHKQTRTGEEARKLVRSFLLGYDDETKPLFGTERRIACANGVLAISGEKSNSDNGLAGREFALTRYHVALDSKDLLVAFQAMVERYGFREAEKRPPHVCAEARLWMTLVALHTRSYGPGQSPRHRHPHPRHLHLWVFEIDGHNRTKEDSPCRNCRQWVRNQFQSVNGT
jgi:hypothetical protein